jgi:prepilin-type N-terminal cleavage/methylation domain-containing protein/prepilin-type processing-associated H-X9-DG protein
MQKKGFTLIELLVVIAIIAILAAILFPVFAKAREKARQTTCLNNQKQIGIALMAYVQDYDEIYPSSWLTDSSYSIYYSSYVDQLMPYMKSKDIWVCPSMAKPGFTESNYLAPAGVIFSVPHHYEANYSMIRWSNLGSASLSQVQSPAGTITFYELYGPNNAATRDISLDWPNYNYVTRVRLDRSTNGIPNSVVHNGGMNIIFADGHSKWMREEAAWADQTLWDLQ